MVSINSQMKYQKQFVTIQGKTMAYVDTGGSGDPLVFFHGNITSSYMWRNVIPHVEDQVRCIAIDNIGQGDSEKLSDSGPDSYRLAEHQNYIDDFMSTLGIEENVTLMMHDWGVQLGLTWARYHPDAMKAIAFTQGVMGDFKWTNWPPEVAELMRKFRSGEGDDLVLKENFFVEKILPAMVIRELPKEVWDEYRRPYKEPGEGRRPTLTWPREIPVEGEPADVLKIIDDNNAWMAASDLPKLFIHCEPETVLKDDILDHVRTFPNQQEVTVKGLHYVHEDSPHEIGEALAEWYRGL
tara:strand:- start:6043 stop:6930 length:888 start_codon:yes stop_codon:yes gene_type:complete